MREPKECSATIWNGVGDPSCGRKGKVKRGKKWYCGIHDHLYTKQDVDRCRDLARAVLAATEEPREV